MSDYGPPTDSQVKQYRGSQARTASWVSQHATSVSPRPPASRSSSSASSRSSRQSSLPPPPPGFKYAPANGPVVFKTQAATYTVLPAGATKPVIVAPPRPHHSHRHSTPPPRQQTYPSVTYKQPSPQPSRSHSHSYTRHQSKSKPKEKPLLHRLFGLDGKRRNSTGGGAPGVSIRW